MVLTKTRWGHADVACTSLGLDTNTSSKAETGACQAAERTVRQHGVSVTTQIKSCPYSNLDGSSSHSLLNLDDSAVWSLLNLVILLDLLIRIFHIWASKCENG